MALGSEYTIFHGLNGMVRSSRGADGLETQTGSFPGPHPPPLESLHWGRQNHLNSKESLVFYSSLCLRFLSEKDLGHCVGAVYNACRTRRG